jgi:hypothetical protein
MLDFRELDKSTQLALLEMEMKIEDSIRVMKNRQGDEAIIDDIYSFELRNIIAHKYKEVYGWKFAYHSTMHEQWGPDRTWFKFSNTELEPEQIKNFHRV